MKSTWGRPDLAASIALLAIFCVLSAVAHATSRDQAKRIHDRIAGVPPDEATLNRMADDIARGDPMRAALRATEAPEFYDVTLKNFAAPWTNREGNVFVPLNDYTATVIGMVRDELDFRLLLSGDILYVGSGPNLPAYSPADNAHYAALEASGAKLRDVLRRESQSALGGIPADATAGVMTTRAASRAFFIAGTNRAMFRFTLVNHLCKDLEQVMDVTRPPDRIRQDVSRSPGGDSRVFLNNCIGCHSGMDPLAQAFAYYDYAYDRETDPEGESGMLVYNGLGAADPVTGSRVVSKYFNNASTFPHGFVTPDDAWSNYWREGPNSVLGWDGSLPGSGAGAKSLGEELANSDAFAQCQVQKVFENVCLRPPRDAGDRAQVESMVSAFRSEGYNLKRVYAASAVYCMGD
jgi:hypothetical protein